MGMPTIQGGGQVVPGPPTRPANVPGAKLLVPQEVNTRSANPPMARQGTKLSGRRIAV
jgi:hypothetical protein